jgi:hypothetical protein
VPQERAELGVKRGLTPGEVELLPARGVQEVDGLHGLGERELAGDVAEGREAEAAAGVAVAVDVKVDGGGEQAHGGHL